MNGVCGLYVSISSSDKIKRNLTTKSGEIKLKTSTIADEIIEFSELNFKPYAKALEIISEMSEQAENDDPKHFGEVDMDIFDSILRFTNNLSDALEEENPLHGLLTKTLLEDSIPADDGTAVYVYNTKAIIDDCLSQVMKFQFIVNEVLNDLRQHIELDFANKYSFLKQIEIIQLYNLGNKLTAQYRFRSLSDYYRFLLVRFITSKSNIARCECCGRYFIPKTKKITMYCDRVISRGKTCKELAPALKHRVASANIKVIEEFDRAKQRMYKRFERAEHYNQKTSDKDLTYEQYYEWLEKAEHARNAFLAGEIPEADALKIINT